MINVITKKCQYDKCRVTPIFNYCKESKGLYCSKHKLDEMVDVINKKCEKDGCFSIPRCNYIGQKGRFCSKHKLGGMVDVNERICNYRNCTKQCKFGFLGELSSRCLTHIEENMICRPRRRCAKEKCDYFASHGLTPSKNEFCIDHAPKHYFALTKRKCKNSGDEICLQFDILNKKGLCRECDPGDHFKFRRKTQELKVKAWLDASDLHSDYSSHDKSFPEVHECFDKRYRPDFLFDCGTHFVVLEVDEHQHRGKTYECDRKRMYEIFASLGLPTIFIRYNPDEYKVDRKKYNPGDASRQKYLFSILDYYKSERGIPENESENFRCIKLYFDDFDKNNFQVENINLEHI